MLDRRRFTAVALLMSLVLSGCGKGPASAARQPVLRVGMDLSYPPFEMQDASGRPDGVSVRMAEALAAALDRPLEIVPMDFSGLIPALKTGHIDLVLSSMTANDERRQSIDFSKPYAFTGLALLVATGSDLQSADGLRTGRRKVAVKAATTGEAWARKNLPDAGIVVFEDPAACVLEVVQGRADAFVYDQLSIFRYARENPGTTRGLLQPFVEEAWAIGIAKGNDAIRSQVDAFLDAFREEGGFAGLGDRYLKEEKAFLEGAGIPFILR